MTCSAVYRGQHIDMDSRCRFRAYGVDNTHPVGYIPWDTSYIPWVYGVDYTYPVGDMVWSTYMVWTTIWCGLHVPTGYKGVVHGIYMVWTIWCG